MTDGPTLCVAAFFRNKGKTVMTEQEFLMGISMNSRWMAYGDAETLLSVLLADGTMKRDGEYIRPAFDLNSIDVPVGYRPPDDLLSSRNDQTDILQLLISKAASAGIEKKEFLSYCRGIQKSLNVEIEVAALIVLRDNGADVSDMTERIGKAVSAKTVTSS